MKACAVSLFALFVLGCRTTERRQFSSSPSAAPRLGTPERSWEVYCEDELAGRIVLFQEAGAVRDSVYVVRNPWHQDLGLIDGLGRAFRYRPHDLEPAWVGSGTIAQGAERILGLHAPCRLLEVSAPDAESGAAARVLPVNTGDPASGESASPEPPSASAGGDSLNPDRGGDPKDLPPPGGARLTTRGRSP